jgi:molecular chaperone GrpE
MKRGRKKKADRVTLTTLKKELKEKTKLAEDYLNRLKYLQADFENYKKRVAKEREEFVKYANEPLIIKLIDIYENLERAVENGKKTEDNEALLQGIEIIYKQLKDVLEKEGLAQIKAVGEKFDPFRHEAVMKEQRDDCEEDTILEEFQRGYTLNDKVIRYSKVKIAKG